MKNLDPNLIFGIISIILIFQLIGALFNGFLFHLGAKKAKIKNISFPKAFLAYLIYSVLHGIVYILFVFVLIKAYWYWFFTVANLPLNEVILAALLAISIVLIFGIVVIKSLEKIRILIFSMITLFTFEELSKTQKFMVRYQMTFIFLYLIMLIFLANLICQ